MKYYVVNVTNGKAMSFIGEMATNFATLKEAKKAGEQFDKGNSEFAIYKSCDYSACATSLQNAVYETEKYREKAIEYHKGEMVVGADYFRYEYQIGYMSKTKKRFKWLDGITFNNCGGAIAAGETLGVPFAVYKATIGQSSYFRVKDYEYCTDDFLEAVENNFVASSVIDDNKGETENGSN